MQNKIIEIANDVGLTGLKRIVFFVISPAVAAVSFSVGFVKGFFKSFEK